MSNRWTIFIILTNVIDLPTPIDLEHWINLILYEYQKTNVIYHFLMITQTFNIYHIKLDNSLSLMQSWSSSSLYDMVDILQQFLIKGKTDNPALNYAFFFSGYTGGTYLKLHNSETTSLISLIDLKHLCYHLNLKFKIICFNGGWINTLEAIYELIEIAQFILGSQSCNLTQIPIPQILPIIFSRFKYTPQTNLNLQLITHIASDLMLIHNQNKTTTDLTVIETRNLYYLISHMIQFRREFQMSIRPYPLQVPWVQANYKYGTVDLYETILQQRQRFGNLSSDGKIKSGNYFKLLSIFDTWLEKFYKLWFSIVRYYQQSQSMDSIGNGLSYYLDPNVDILNYNYSEFQLPRILGYHFLYRIN